MENPITNLKPKPTGGRLANPVGEPGWGEHVQLLWLHCCRLLVLIFCSFKTLFLLLFCYCPFHNPTSSPAMDCQGDQDEISKVNIWHETERLMIMEIMRDVRRVDLCFRKHCGQTFSVHRNRCRVKFFDWNGQKGEILLDWQTRGSLHLQTELNQRRLILRLNSLLFVENICETYTVYLKLINEVFQKYNLFYSP